MSIGAKERVVFGQWLVGDGRLDPRVLETALEIQNTERSDTLRSSPRLLGQILLDDFQVFRSRIELNQALIKFETVKAALEERKSELNSHNEGSSAPGHQKSSSSHKPAPDRSLFGQFLIEKKKINETILERALDIQNLESKDLLRKSHRLLGEILIDEFNVFSSRVELNRLLVEFDEFKVKIESQRTELMHITRRYG